MRSGSPAAASNGSGVGSLATFIGVFMLGPLIARPISAVLGAPIAAGAGVSGAIARQNAMRNPKRTSRTGGALMVGVALVAAITVIAASVRDWTRDAVSELFTGDYVVSTSMYGYGGLSPDLAAEVAALPEVDVASGVRVGAAHDVDLDGDLRYLAIDPATASQIFDVDMVTGSVAQLTENGILIDDDEAASRGVGVGDTVDVRVPRRIRPARSPSRASIETMMSSAPTSSIRRFTSPPASTSSTSACTSRRHRARIPIGWQRRSNPSPASYPNADVQSRSEYIDARAAQFDQIVNLMYALLALAAIIALVNIANSLVLSIHERTHELGLLRAVGMTRRQTSSSVIWEAVLVALLGDVARSRDRHVLRMVDQRCRPRLRVRRLRRAESSRLS